MSQDIKAIIIAAIITAIATIIGALLGRANLGIKLIIILVVSSIIISTVIIFLIIPTDKWLNWENSFKESLSKCNGDNHDCKRLIINRTIKDIPPENPEYKLSGIVGELRAGSIILTNTYDVLRDDFGIQPDTYLGTGISVSKTPLRLGGGLLEFWAPNLNETHEAVWTWKLSPAFVAGGRTVRETIKNLEPTSESDQGDLRFRDCVDENSPNFNACGLNDNLDCETRPVLFRCAQFDEKDYKGYVGRENAKRVFFVRLRDVYDLKVADACARSGRLPSNNGHEGTEKYFIWIFIPSHENESVPATWGNLFFHFGEWENFEDK